MRMSIQHWDSNQQSSDCRRWAVVLDGEQIMFVGDYQACEDWLDRIEAIGHDPALPRGNTAYEISEQSRQRGANWLQDFCCEVRAFIFGDDGSFKASEGLLIIGALCLFQVLVFYSAWTFIKGRIPGQQYLRSPSIVNQRSTQPGHTRQRNSNVEALDIVCDQP